MLTNAFNTEEVHVHTTHTFKHSSENPGAPLTDFHPITFDIM